MCPNSSRGLYFRNFLIFSPGFECLVKKCPNIKHLKTESEFPSEDNEENTEDSINAMNNRLFDDFHKKFDFKSMKLLVDWREDKKNVFKWFDSLSYDKKRYKSWEVNRIGIKRSRRLAVHLLYKQTKHFQQFIENNKTLKTLQIYTNISKSSHLLKRVPKLDQLIELTVIFDPIKTLMKISDNWP